MRRLAMLAAGLLLVAGCGVRSEPAATPEAPVTPAPATAEASFAHPPECVARETAIYRCEFGRKVISMCGTDSSLTYRFGTRDATEMEIVSRTGAPTAHVGMVIGGGGGSQTHVRFTREGVDYVVHTMEAGSLTEVAGQRFSGVSVLKSGEDLIDLRCARTGDAQVFDISNLPDGTYLSEEEEGPYDMWF